MNRAVADEGIEPAEESVDIERLEELFLQKREVAARSYIKRDAKPSKNICHLRGDRLARRCQRAVNVECQSCFHIHLRNSKVDSIIADKYKKLNLPIDIFLKQD